MVWNAIEIRQKLCLLNHCCWISGLWEDLRDASDSSGARHSRSS